MEDQSKYIFSKGSLEQKDFSIDFKNEKGHAYIPIKNTKELYLFSDCTITTKLISLIGKTGIVIHFFDYYGNYVGSFFPKEQLLSGNFIIEQSLAYINKREIIAKAIVNGIAINIHETLYHYYRHGKVDLKDSLDYLKKDVPNLLNKDLNINQIMMIEGTIWARFYDSFKYFLPKDFFINKRVKRPPDNPMNAMISFSNSILYAKTITQIYQTHLNQTISFLHEPSEGRFSLSLDLSEVFKPIIVYKTIFDLVNNKKIKIDKHFRKDFNYALLNEEGMKIFISALDERMNISFHHPILNRKITYKTAIKIDGYKLIKYIMEGKEFKPFNNYEKY